jgi:hypothetical protein
MTFDSYYFSSILKKNPNIETIHFNNIVCYDEKLEIISVHELFEQLIEKCSHANLQKVTNHDSLPHYFLSSEKSKSLTNVIGNQIIYNSIRFVPPHLKKRKFYTLRSGYKIANKK